MFKCAICNATAKTPHNYVSIIREKQYIIEYYEENPKTKRKDRKIRNNEGWEIVEQLKLCANCYNEYKDKNPTVVR